MSAEDISSVALIITLSDVAVPIEIRILFEMFVHVKLVGGGFENTLKMMQTHIFLLMIAVNACNANINITGGDTLYFEKSEKLSIMCTNNVEAIVEFRKGDSQLTTCVLSTPCAVSDIRFNVTHSNVSSERQYFLETVGNFTTDKCGSYDCVDVLNKRNDTVNVFLKDFDNNFIFPEENKDELSVTTACVFPAVLDNMEISWYTFHEESLEEISDKDLDVFNSFNRSTPCPNVTCDMIQAQSFTYGLKFNETRLSLSLVEIKIVHPMFKDKPLIWRSSKRYPVVFTKYAPDESGLPGWLPVVCGLVGAALIICVFVCLYYRYPKKMEKLVKEMEEKRKLVLTLPLFSSFEEGEKRVIADSMVLKHKTHAGNGTKTVYMQYKLYVIVEGALHVTERDKTFGWSCGFVNPFEFIMLPTASILNKEWPVLRGKANIKIHKVPLNTKVEAPNDVKLLVMDSDSYTNILMENTKWQSVLSGKLPPTTPKEREPSDLAQIIVERPSESKRRDDTTMLIIIEAYVLTNGDAGVTTDKVPVGDSGATTEIAPSGDAGETTQITPSGDADANIKIAPTSDAGDGASISSDKAHVLTNGDAGVTTDIVPVGDSGATTEIAPSGDAGETTQITPSGDADANIKIAPTSDAGDGASISSDKLTDSPNPKQTQKTTLKKPGKAKTLPQKTPKTTPVKCDNAGTKKPSKKTNENTSSDAGNSTTLVPRSDAVDITKIVQGSGVGEINNKIPSIDPVDAKIASSGESGAPTEIARSGDAGAVTKIAQSGDAGNARLKVTIGDTGDGTEVLSDQTHVLTNGDAGVTTDKVPVGDSDATTEIAPSGDAGETTEITSSGDAGANIKIAPTSGAGDGSSISSNKDGTVEGSTTTKGRQTGGDHNELKVKPAKPNDSIDNVNPGTGDNKLVPSTETVSQQQDIPGRVVNKVAWDITNTSQVPVHLPTRRMTGKKPTSNGTEIFT